MGIKDIRMFNATLLTKWKWRLLSEKKGMWKYILISKYGTSLDVISFLRSISCGGGEIYAKVVMRVKMRVGFEVH